MVTRPRMCTSTGTNTNKQASKRPNKQTSASNAVALLCMGRPVLLCCQGTAVTAAADAPAATVRRLAGLMLLATRWGDSVIRRVLKRNHKRNRIRNPSGSAGHCSDKLAFNNQSADGKGSNSSSSRISGVGRSNGSSSGSGRGGWQWQQWQ